MFRRNPFGENQPKTKIPRFKKKTTKNVVQQTKQRLIKTKPKAANPNKYRTRIKPKRLRVQKGSKPKTTVNDKVHFVNELRD